MHLKELDANLIVVLDALLIDASVTKAAERLGRSPSAVSHALSNLRHIFDDELFVRAGQRLAPTVKATELAPTVHIIVSGLESLLRPTEPFDPAQQARTFLIAATDMAELYLLSRLRHELATEAPNISLERIALDSTQFLDDLRQGQIDFALIEGEIKTDVPDMRWTSFGQESFLTLSPGNGAKTGGAKAGVVARSISKSAFKAMPHMLPCYSGGVSSLLQEALIGEGLPPELIHEVSSSMLGALLALEMNGLVTMSRQHGEMIARHVNLEPVALPFKLPQMMTHLGWHRRFERDECHAWLRAKVEAVFST